MLKRIARRTALAAASLLVCHSSAAKADTITITSGPSVGAGLQWWGASTPFYDPSNGLPHGLVGQSFTVPSGVDFLSAIAFQTTIVFSPFLYAAQIEQWDPVTNTAIGPVLFDSGSLTLPRGTVDLIALNPNIAVTPGATYIAWFQSTAALPKPDFCTAPGSLPTDCPPFAGFGLASSGIFPSCTDTPSARVFCPTDADVYSGGSFYIGSTKYNFDASFTAQFTTPEPATLVLVAPGLLGLAAFARRKRRSDAHGL